MLKRVSEISDQLIIGELKTFPNQGIILEILQNQVTGKIFQLSDGAFLVMENCSDPFVFIAGQLAERNVLEAISLVQGLDYPMVYCQPKYHPLFLHHGWNFHLRAEFSLDIFNNAEATNTSIQPIKDLSLFKRCSWYKERSELYGSDNNYLAHGTGYALCTGSDVASEAYASIGGGNAEIGVITDLKYRGKGYAQAVVSHLLKQCIDAKLSPKWSCNVNNIASFRLGLKLGFIIDRYYTLLVPDCGNVLCKKLVERLKNNNYSV